MTIDDMEPAEEEEEGQDAQFAPFDDDDNSYLLDDGEEYDKLVVSYDGLTLADERSRGCEDRDRGASISFEAMCQVSPHHRAAARLHSSHDAEPR